MDAALDLVCELRPLSLLVNPHLVASILRFCQVPPKHWNTNIGIEQARQALAEALEQVALSAESQLSGRKLHIQLMVDAPKLLLRGEVMLV